MKKFIIVFFLFFSSITAHADILEKDKPHKPTTTEIVSVYAGYIAGAVAGAQYAVTHYSVVVGTALAGEAITAVPLIPLFGFTFAGAIAGSIAGYYVYKGVVYVYDHRGKILAKLKEGTQEAEDFLKAASENKAG